MTIKDEICPAVKVDARLMGDGTLWIKTDKIDDIGRVIVEDGKTSCKQFYQDAHPVQCEDAVSREAVLDALRTCYDTETITYDNGDEYIHYGDAVGEVEQLPPVTPKQSTEALKAEIKRMKRSFTICINSDYYTGYMSALSAVEGYIVQWEGANDAKT